MADARDNGRGSHGLSRGDLARVAKATRAAEKAAVGGNPSGGQGYPGRRRVPVIPNILQVRVVQTPGGGIPAATGTYPNITCGSATCSLALLGFGGTYSLVSPTVNVACININTAASIAANKLVVVNYVGGSTWVVVAEPCS